MQCPTCGTNTPATLGRSSNCDAPLGRQFANTPATPASMIEFETFEAAS